VTTLSFTALSLSFAAPLPSMPTPTRYIDFADGNDAADGLTPETAWQHDPGDPLASGVADAHVIGPGDVFAFKGGVRYRSRIVMGPPGTAESRAVRLGNYPGFGVGRAIFDGAEPVESVRVATSQVDAGGIANWADADIRVVEFSSRPHGMTLALYDTTGLLFPNQYPVPVDYYTYDDIQASPSAAITAAVAGWDTATPSITNAELAAECAGQTGLAQVAVWVDGSQMQERTVLSVVGNVVTLDGAFTRQPYTPTTKIYVRHTMKALGAGCWARLSDTKAVVRLRNGDAAVRVGRSLFGSSVYRMLNASGASYHTVRGFRFEAFTGQGPGGSAEAIIRASNGSSVGLEVYDNLFTDCSDDSGSLVCVHSTNLSGQSIRRNRFQNLHTFGAVLANSTGFEIEENVFDRVGRTAIRMTEQTGDTDDVPTFGRIRRNILSRIRGVHTNAIALYGQWKDYIVEDNAVLETPRPLTMQGAPSGPSNRLVRGNLLVASPTDGNGWAGWHNGTADIGGLTFDNNVNIGWAAGLLVKTQCTALVLTDNLGTDGAAGNGPGEGPGYAVEAGGSDLRDSWTTSGNESIAADYLTTSGAIVAVDQVRVQRKRGLLELDLRGVGA
jgi:hypothetical protein